MLTLGFAAAVAVLSVSLETKTGDLGMGLSHGARATDNNWSWSIVFRSRFPAEPNGRRVVVWAGKWREVKQHHLLSCFNANGHFEL